MSEEGKVAAEAPVVADAKEEDYQPPLEEDLSDEFSGDDAGDDDFEDDEFEDKKKKKKAPAAKKTSAAPKKAAAAAAAPKKKAPAKRKKKDDDEDEGEFKDSPKPKKAAPKKKAASPKKEAPKKKAPAKKKKAAADDEDGDFDPEAAAAAAGGGEDGDFEGGAARGGGDDEDAPVVKKAAAKRKKADDDDDEDFGGGGGGGDDDDEDDEDAGDPEDEDEDEAPKKKGKTGSAAPKKAAGGGGAKATKAAEDKAKKVPDGKAPGVIMEYMRAQNRPFNAVMLQQNLHGAVSLAQAKKFLESLAKDGKLTELVNKKQKIYWINQEDLEVVDANELRKMDDHIKELKEEEAELDKEIAGLEARIKEVATTLTNEQLEAEIPKLTTLVEEKRAKVAKLQEGRVQIDPGERDKLVAQREKWRKMWQKRRLLLVKEVLPFFRENEAKYDDEAFEMDEAHGADYNSSNVDQYYKKNGGQPPAAANGRASAGKVRAAVGKK